MLAELGFETHDLPPQHAARLRAWANLLRRAYGNPPDAPAPQLSILSRQDFLKLYGD
ncbi:hypothetical protein ACFP81_01135 [Deinococcus lacus]|uniref:Uncharacterized protein n=1 Tax=Deinococcus lacus TaxID=392561 RepID=A0ABW1Y8Y5_9DEIO